MALENTRLAWIKNAICHLTWWFTDRRHLWFVDAFSDGLSIPSANQILTRLVSKCSENSFLSNTNITTSNTFIFTLEFLVWMHCTTSQLARAAILASKHPEDHVMPRLECYWSNTDPVVIVYLICIRRGPIYSWDITTSRRQQRSQQCTVRFADSATAAHLAVTRVANYGNCWGWTMNKNTYILVNKSSNGDNNIQCMRRLIVILGIVLTGSRIR